MRPVLFILLLIINADNFMLMQNSQITIDSNYTFEEAVADLEFPVEIKKQLTIIDVLYFGFDEKIHKGQLVISRLLSGEVKEIFDRILAARFPIEKVIPIVKYGWDDNKSMQDNNTSAFNYRVIAGTGELSNHSYGTAIDINPKLNPFIKGKTILPKNGSYNKSEKGTLTPESVVVKLLKKKGWTWGGSWRSRKDYQHFEKADK